MIESNIPRANWGHPPTTEQPTWRRFVDNWYHAGLDILFPPACALCNVPLPEPGPLPRVCDSCEAAMGIGLDQRCDCCGHLLNLGQQPPPDEGPPDEGPPDEGPPDEGVVVNSGCVRCSDIQFAFARVVVLGSYDGHLKQAILRMKHAGEQPLAAAMGRMLGRQLVQANPPVIPDVVTHVPMHLTRRWKRRANSAEIIAETMARQLSIPHRRLLRTIRRTEKQSMLSPSQRPQNVRGAFAATTRAATTRTRDEHVAIVDDTFTTGATANEASKVLLRGGAKRVTVVVLGRAASAW